MEITNFKLKHSEYNEMDCKVPCSLFSVLSKNGCLPDPYADDNERLYLEKAKSGCVFRSIFDFKPDKGKKYVFSSGCIDTLAKIYLNGKFIAKTDNVFYPLKIELDYNVFNCGENILEIKIESPVAFLERAIKRHYTDSQMDTPKIGLYGRALLRKPQYSFGWDWSAALPDMGIYEPITIESKHSELEGFAVKQIHSDRKVSLEITSETPCLCKLYSPNGNKVGETIVDAGGGEIIVEKPELWWCNGLGDQPLYKLTAEYQDEYSDMILTESRTIGLRSIEIEQVSDEYGRSFGFILNGKPIFAMGANYLPEDNILPRCNNVRTTDLLAKCKSAGFNVLRVWGGGLYASERFLEECDKSGIIVWQDCAFACQAVYLSEDFKKSVKAEIEYQIKRIAKHPSLGIICGNNEIEAMIGDRAKHCYGQLNHRPWLDAVNYLELFERIIPDLCEKYAPDVFYWPCSPSGGGGFYKPLEENFGDSHLWNIWGGNKPLDNYKNFFPRFCSEYGFISYPDEETILTFSSKKIADTSDDAVKSHFKRLIYADDQFSVTERYIEKSFGKCKTLREKTEKSQILQGKVLKGFIEHLRIHRNRCRGSLYWQLNDSCPSVSWSTIDYYGKEKLSLKYIAEAYAPVIIAAENKKGVITVYVSNESKNVFEGELYIGEKKKTVSVPPFCAKSESVFKLKKGKSIKCTLFDKKSNVISEYVAENV